MFDRSKLESLRDVSVTRIGDAFSYGFPQTDRSVAKMHRIIRGDDTINHTFVRLVSRLGFIRQGFTPPSKYQ